MAGEDEERYVLTPKGRAVIALATLLGVTTDEADQVLDALILLRAEAPNRG